MLHRNRGTAVVLASLLLTSLGMSRSALADPGQMVVLSVLWRNLVGSHDRMTTTSPTERDAFALEGATWYVPKYQIGGTSPLYRLYNGSDHMDSNIAGEGGYATEGVLGYAYASQALGTQPIMRGWNPSISDHATPRTYESLAGYTTEPTPIGYGYFRFNSYNESLTPLSAGSVGIQSNAVAGGALWEWWWNNVQFLNDYDYGRQIQSAFIWGDYTVNPTEAGDVYSSQPLVAARHGSPALSISNAGSTMSTRAIPLEWNASLHGGGPDSPVIWKDCILGKDITLNYNGMGPVAKYVTYLYIPQPIGANAQIEIPCGYMRAVFNRWWTYNAGTQTLSEVFPPPFVDDENVEFRADYGGVIISNADGTYAMGVYGASTAVGGSVSYFTLFNYLNLGGSGGQYDQGCSKWDAVWGPGTIPAGENRFTTYITSGTLGGVTANMRSLFLQGAK